MSTENLYDVIKKPLITEKSMMGIAQGQYTFEVVKSATKVDIAKAIELVFLHIGVTPILKTFLVYHFF